MIKKFSIFNFQFSNYEGFTLLEILVVIAIITILMAGAAISYSQFAKQSRDARRKADLEQIRAALEMYRSTNNVYPSTLTISCISPGSIVDPAPGTNTYLNKIPSDPKCDKTTNTPNYSYSSPAPNQTYSLTANLEDGTVYTLNPYGQQ